VSIGDWDIFGEVARLRRELGRVPAGFGMVSHSPRREDVWTPAVDIHEREDQLLLSVDLPGLTREQIGLEVDESTLTIEGERTPEGAPDHIRLERPMGRFRRSFRLRMMIDPSGVRASYRDGVLYVTIPKVAPRDPTRLRVDVE
jgi:HSP20 family protein